MALNLFRTLVIYLSPVLPNLAEKAGELLGEDLNSWELTQNPVTGRSIAKFKHMMQRVDPKKIEAMIEESKDCLLYTSDAADE